MYPWNSECVIYPFKQWLHYVSLHQWVHYVALHQWVHYVALHQWLRYVSPLSQHPRVRYVSRSGREFSVLEVFERFVEGGGPVGLPVHGGLKTLLHVWVRGVGAQLKTTQDLKIMVFIGGMWCISRLFTHPVSFAHLFRTILPHFKFVWDACLR